MKEFDYFENKINIQQKILNELKLKQKYLNEDEDILQKEIKNIKSNLIFKKDKVDKNKKEINLLIKKNNNLSNDKVIKSKVYFLKKDSNNSINSIYLKKISELQKIVNFYKSQNKYNESIINKLKEQKKTSLESLKLSQNIKYSPSFLSLKLNNIQSDNKEKRIINNKDSDKINNDEEEKVKNENDKNANLTEDEKKINELRIIYENTKNEEKKMEEEYKKDKEKIKQINDYIQQQNMVNSNNANNEEEKTQNQVEFGIDENNPYYTENEDNQPEIENKFTSTQFNQFTYILFKNFEAKGIVLEESKNKIINPFIKLVNENKLEMVQYPSEQFNFIVEEFTKIILNTINSENNYNHSLTKIFIGALLINSGCYVQKLIEYFNILFSYTRNYINEEEKYLNKLRDKYKEQIENLIICINANLENEKKLKNSEEENYPIYFPLIKIKEIIEGNNIILKDKYVEFLFYFLKKFNDNTAKLDELKYSLLNDILYGNNDKVNDNDNKDIKINVDNNILNEKNNTSPNNININTNRDENNKENDNNDNKDITTNENIKDNNDIIKNNDENINMSDNKDNYKDININTEKKIENYSNMEDSMTEITNEEYIRQINDAIKIIKNGLKKKKISFSEFIKDIKQSFEVENKVIECFTIDNFNQKLKDIGITLSDLKLSCLCSKYSLPNELRIIEIKNLEEDIKSNKIKI